MSLKTGIKLIFNNLYKLIPRKKYTKLEYIRNIDEYKTKTRLYSSTKEE